MTPWGIASKTYKNDLGFTGKLKIDRMTNYLKRLTYFLYSILWLSQNKYLWGGNCVFK